jgi:hypothetical protein
MPEITDLKSLISKRGIIKGRVTRFKSFLDVPENRVKLLEIQRRIQELQSYQAKEEELFKFEDEFFDTISSADAIVKSIENTSGPQPADGPSGSGQSPTIGRENPAVKLSNIYLPTFSGVLTEWITFRDSYNALINDNRDLSDIHKFHYKASGGTRFCHICSKYFCFCAENLKLYNPPSRQRKRKQSLDLFCYETLEDNE